MLTPRFAAEPVNAPKNAMDFPQLLLPPDAELLLLLVLHAAAPPMSASIAAPPTNRTSPCLTAPNPSVADDASPRCERLVRAPRRVPIITVLVTWDVISSHYTFKKPCEAGSRNLYVMGRGGRGITPRKRCSSR